MKYENFDLEEKSRQLKSRGRGLTGYATMGAGVFTNVIFAPSEYVYRSPEAYATVIAVSMLSMVAGGVRIGSENERRKRLREEIRNYMERKDLTEPLARSTL